MLRSFGLPDLLKCSANFVASARMRRRWRKPLRRSPSSRSPPSIDEETDGPAFALAPLYKTHRLDELEPDLKPSPGELTASPREVRESTINGVI